MSTDTLYEIVDRRIDTMSTLYPYLESEHLPSLRHAIAEIRALNSHEVGQLNTRIAELREHIKDLGGEVAQKPAVLRKGRAK